jgi:Fe2+ or Zn2+ uptake regulation protein
VGAMRLTHSQRYVLETIVKADEPLSYEDIAAACEDYETTPWTFKTTDTLIAKGLVERGPWAGYWVATDEGRRKAAQ